MVRSVGRLLPATLVATFGLILLGVYTAAIGAGLTCDARWPLCDGAVFGLFPANWPSFVEWFHRLVAMVTGFMILGSWIVAWRAGVARRIRWALSLAVVLLPVQIWLGAETVLTYDLLVLRSHFLAALPIFGALILATGWQRNWHHADLSSVRRMLASGILLMLPFALLKPQFLFVHTGGVQVAYIGLGVLVFAIGLVLAMAARGDLVRSLLGGLVSVLLAIQLLAARPVRSDVIVLTDWGTFVVATLTLLVAYWTLRTSGDAKLGRLKPMNRTS